MLRLGGLLLAVLGCGGAAQILAQAPAAGAGAQQVEWPVAAPRNLLDLHHEPGAPTDRSHEMFFDQGAWHGYALPGVGDTGTGFVGPFLSATGPGIWAGNRFGTLELLDAATGAAIPLRASDGGGAALPGALVRHALGDRLSVEETLFYASASTALVRVTVSATAARRVRLEPGALLREGADTAELTTRVAGPARVPARVIGGGYRFPLPEVFEVAPGHTVTIYLQQTYLPAGPGTALHPWLEQPEAAWTEAGKRWQGYLRAGESLRPELSARADARWINAKAIVTLLANWRAPLGDLRHAGLFPSYSNPDFSAFWAWDSWKHAAALARFAPALAEDQVRAMFDFQAPDGMIPDNVFRDRGSNNLRNTKPPLAAWAVGSIYRQSHDRAFVAEMFDGLLRYHRWWYQNRDHDHDGLAEYGATDGTMAAARWESGMDNAVRFDETKLLRNSAHAWSMDQESVDLNCYLYQDKIELAGLAEALGKRAVAAQLRAEAAILRGQIRRVFFSQQLGYFFDVRLGNRTRVAHFGPEGWIALWTGVADASEARAVARVLADPAKFNTPFPFPTLARDDPRFSTVAQPSEHAGYWRGPVWIDQAVFAVQGLDRYGMAAQAQQMRDKLLGNSPGLAGTEPFRETYDSGNGAGGNSRNFSWSAAEYFLMLH